jgi:hypothetical protein
MFYEKDKDYAAAANVINFTRFLALKNKDQLNLFERSSHLWQNIIAMNTRILFPCIRSIP